MEKNTKQKLPRKKKVMIALSLLFLVFIGRCAFGCYGPYFGIVLDADNYLPVRHAQVKVEVDYYGPLNEQISTKLSFGRSNFMGIYFVPGTYQLFGIFFSTMDFKLYKHGYIVYSNRYKIFEETQKPLFLPIFNIALLKKWDDEKLTDKDHVSHVGVIGCATPGARIRRKDLKRLKKFCTEAREEMILACMAEYENTKYPRNREKCTEYIDVDLGLLREENKQ